jgi:hypothetical protein
MRVIVAEEGLTENGSESNKRKREGEQTFVIISPLLSFSCYGFSPSPVFVFRLIVLQ